MNDTILCIRFPFLYPKNRWTGMHWQSWKIHEYLYGHPQMTTYKNWDKKIIVPQTNGIRGKAFKQVPKPNRIYDFETIDKIKSLPWAIWYYVVYCLYRYFLPIFHCIPTYTELDELEPGWRKAFGIQLCKDLKKAAKKDGYKFRIMQMKEKWGFLHLYLDRYGPEVSDVIKKYEDLSWNTCISCGKPATVISKGWISPYCDDCINSNNIYRRKIDGKWVNVESEENAEDEEKV